MSLSSLSAPFWLQAANKISSTNRKIRISYLSFNELGVKLRILLGLPYFPDLCLSITTVKITRDGFGFLIPWHVKR
jgi:hypothetical protein